MAEMTDFLAGIANARAKAVYSKASETSEKLLANCRQAVDQYLESKGYPADKVCVIAVGSVGRREAMDASDLDIIPVLAPDAPPFDAHDKPLRKAVTDACGVKVSAGDDLTRFVTTEELTSAESIGGDEDSSAALTKRILILTESQHAGGKYPLTDVRRTLLAAYAAAERTSGRHVLSLCNDIARYYRTLCIEYKAKIDNEDKDWCTRNAKLRHSRKFWYFATQMSIVAAARTGAAEKEYTDRLLDAFGKSPTERLVDSIPLGHRHSVGTLVESYAWFLEFMGVKKNRSALSLVSHANRYAVTVENPFPAVKFNSDVIQGEIVALIDSLDRVERLRVFAWFLF